MKITVMDKRHKGKLWFSFYVTPTMTSVRPKVDMFIIWREWCFETFGLGIERDLAHHREDVKWAWHTEDGLLRIYFKSQKELNWFKMKWL